MVAATSARLGPVRLRQGWLGLIVLVFGYFACGGDPELVSPTGTTGTGGAGGQVGDGGSSDGGSILPTDDCETGTVCGGGDCCEASEQCVLGVCRDTCDSGVRCGADLAICCAGGEVCLAGACTAPGAPCQDFADCEEGEFCEPTISRCLPQPGDDLCEYVPQIGTLTPAVEWSWTSSPIEPSAVQVINAPVVGDLDKDGVPDVVIVTSDNYSGTGAGFLRALDGATGAEKWAAGSDVYVAAHRVNPRGTPALGDIDGDGFAEIVTPKAGGGLIAFEHDGTFKWSSTQTDGVTPYTTSMSSATVAIADFEGDGTPEIAVGGVVFEANGALRFDQGVYSGSNNGNYGAVSIVADLDGQGDQELVTGRRAFRSDGTVYWDNGQIDGYPAIADLDLDGTPEVVVVAGGILRVQDPTTGVVLASLAMPAAGAGGPPTIANFDGDPEPEIASANGGAYAVFGYASLPTPTLTLQWSQPTQDLSSNRTGSSVFDFEGDGVAEVVYGDECYFRIYSGPDGTVLQEIESSSATIHEYPVVVDVDGDNNTEVVVAANNLNHLSNGVTCPYPAAQSKAGVFVYGDANDQWVRTRKLWNQHAYHITNVSSTLGIPAPESPSWVVPPGFNNYRQSNQGAGVFNAPDLQVSLGASLQGCPASVELVATVQNLGSLGVAAGIPVSFYEGATATGTPIATVNTTQALLPGQFEIVTVSAPTNGTSFSVRVDADGMGMGQENECLEDNNDASVEDVICPNVE